MATSNHCWIVDKKPYRGCARQLQYVDALRLR
jgi:hypothetical protein